MKLKSIPARLGYIVGAQWTRDLAWTAFTILLARRNPDIMGQIILALTFGYLVKTAADVGLNDFLLASFARRECSSRRLLGEVTCLKLAALFLALAFLWLVCGWQDYSFILHIVILAISAGLGLDAVCDSFFALCQARGRQDVEMRIRIPASLIGLGYGIICVLLDASVVAIALFKPIEAVVCLILVSRALGRTPLVKFGCMDLRDLGGKMKSGLIFSGMAVCAMLYNKINVIFLKKYGGNAEVAGYGVAWETVEGLSVLVSSALLGKVIFPMLARLWQENRQEFRKLAGQTARALWAGSLPLIFLLYVESDRFLPFIYGDAYKTAVIAQQLLTPCIATAFLHNLAAYAMIGMQRQKLLFIFYLSGLLLNLVCCYVLIRLHPLEGAALSLTITKVWVAVCTVGFFQWKATPMRAGQWLALLLVCMASFSFWRFSLAYIPREAAEFAGLLPLLALLWHWRPPAPFEKNA